MRVLLVHGMGRTPLAMLWLGYRLRREGWAPEYFGYAAFAQSHAGIVAALAARLRHLAAGGTPVGLVGHSLGGLLLRQAVAETPGLRVQALVMLGTPNRPPRLAVRLRGNPLYRLSTGECGQFLGSPDRIHGLPPPHFPCLVIAGEKGWPPVVSPFGHEPNDGFVAVEETRMDGRETHLVLPVGHTFMMNRRVVQDAVVAALRG